jgi:predicted nucleotidyltransferase
VRGGGGALRQEELAEECARIAADLSAAGVLRVIAYGSFARGTAGPSSDLDLLVIVPEDGLDFRRRLARLYALASPRLPCDILAYTEAELAALVPSSDLIATALREGRTVYCRPEGAEGAGA